MKKLFIIASLIFTANLSAQTIVKEYGILVREYSSYTPVKVEVVLLGKVEIDGHDFDNEKSKDPVKFEADLDGIKIYDSKREYQKRKCNIEKCKIIHLESKNSGTSILGSGYIPNYYQNNTLELIK